MKKILLPFIFCISLFSFSQGNEKVFLEKAKPALIADFKKGQNEFWIMLEEQADVSGTKLLKTKNATKKPRQEIRGIF